MPRKLGQSLEPIAQAAPQNQKAKRRGRKRGKAKAAETKRANPLETSESSDSDLHGNEEIAWRNRMRKLMANNKSWQDLPTKNKDMKKKTKKKKKNEKKKEEEK